MRYGRIGRRVYKTVCQCVVFDADNNRKEIEVEVWGEYDVTRAEKKAREVTGIKRLLVNSVRIENFYASMPLEKFVELADITEH